MLATYAYDNLGRRTGLTFGNGAVQAFAYDPVSRLASLTNDLTGTANDLTVTINGYNPASQITSQTRSNDLYAWTGHGTGSTASVANGLNQLTSIGGSATTHDAKGNLTTDPTTGKSYGYSSENLLTSASGGVTLAYDPSLRLYQVAGAATTRLAYDGLALIAEYNASNALQRRFVHGPSVDEPLVQYEGTGTTDRRWLHADERGSVIATSDSAGNMLTINRYDEFGKPQSTNSGRFQYTGQMWLSEIGAYYYKARVYAPHLGRFLQTDPVGYADSPNLYAYVLNSPTSFIDPLGLIVCLGSHINTDNCGGSSGPLSCSGDCRALGGPLLTINEQRKIDEEFNARCPDVFACNLLQPASLASLASGHDYVVGPFYVCSGASCTAAIQQTFPSYVVPHLGQAVSNGQISPVYLFADLSILVGHVQTFFYDNGFSAQNITQSDHWLCCGTVDIVNWDISGSWYVAAYGSGTNYFGVGWANQAFGPVVFKGMLGSYISIVRARANTYGRNQ